MMKMKKRRTICTILCFLMIFSISVYADVSDIATGNSNIVTEYNSPDLLTPLPEEEAIATTNGVLDVPAKSAILIEQHTGTVLFEKNPDEKIAPASVTKIMSLLLIMEAIDGKKIKLDDVVTCSEHAASMGGSQIWLEPNETMMVHELLKATAIGSANDATCALGEFIAGSEEGFVALMNERAKQLGMKNTNFVNCTGLDAEGHLTTARDISIMSRELMKHDLIKQYSKVWMDSLRGGQTQLVNTNKLVRFYDGITGLKTGTTDHAGHCLSATASRGSMDIIAVVMGSESGADRFLAARKLLDSGFANWARAKVTISKDELKDIPVTGGMQKTVKIKAEGSNYMLVPKGKEKEIKKTINLPEQLKAPVKKGNTVGKIVITLDGKSIGEIAVKADETVEAMNFGRALLRLSSALFSL